MWFIGGTWQTSMLARWMDRWMDGWMDTFKMCYWLERNISDCFQVHRGQGEARRDVHYDRHFVDNDLLLTDSYRRQSHDLFYPTTKCQSKQGYMIWSHQYLLNTNLWIFLDWPTKLNVLWSAISNNNTLYW